MKRELFQRFILLMFNNLIRASCSGIVIDGVLYLTIISIHLADQPEDRTVLFIKRTYSYMECTNCAMTTYLSADNMHLQNMPSSSEDDNTNTNQVQLTRRHRHSVLNTVYQLSRGRFCQLDVSATPFNQLTIANHKLHLHLKPSQLSNVRNFLLVQRAHTLPPALG